MRGRLATILIGFSILCGTEGWTQQANGRKHKEDRATLEMDTVEFQLLQVNKILIVGNKTTHDRIILRELSLHPGDTISNKEITKVLQKDRNKIYNLRLFNTVDINTISHAQGKVDLLIELTERWYTFPVP
ncbi:MAG TPA: POTRA domain-containing protein, partial [Cyclobacteriaceae bacterium]|nr:POTRA domain-containing protein [Cyclobacteriaceae bacterium]